MKVDSSSEQASAISLLTGGGDKPYVLGLSSTLTASGIHVDLIGSDELDVPELRRNSLITFLNLRGDQRTNASFTRKAGRIVAYYLRLLHYAATARPQIFHVLWNNRFEFADRTFLMLYYRMCGRRIALTAHNVNAGKRDSTDTVWNRLSLFVQYKLAHHIFVHTAKMKSELVQQFALRPCKVSVIPLGVNNTVPVTDLTSVEAKRRLDIKPEEKTLLFFGRIAPYKGLHHLIDAFASILKTGGNYRLVIVGSVQKCPEYWVDVQRRISQDGVREHLLERIEFIPDEETEVYFKAADVLILPYTEIFQSGVLVLAYSFGLPVIAADTGSFREEILEGQTGYVCRAKDPADLARTIELYFSSSLFRELERRRQEIRDYANTRYSWIKVGEITTDAYKTLART